MQIIANLYKTQYTYSKISIRGLEYMKKVTAFIMILALVAGMLSGCKGKQPKSVMFNGKEYKSGFYGDRDFLHDLSSMTSDEFEIDGITYVALDIEEHDWICTKEEHPTVFCSAENWEKEREFYTNKENYVYGVSFGPVRNPVDMLQVTGMDDKEFEDVVKFAKEHSFNPKHPKANKGQLLCPVPESNESEIHFYRESNDNMFSEAKVYTYFMINNQAVMLYSYDVSGSGESSDEYCYVILVNDTVNELLTNLVGVLSAMG